MQRRAFAVRRAQLLDGGYVEIVERDGGWTYQAHPTPEGGEVPDIYSDPIEAEAFARNRYEMELVTDFADVSDGEPAA